MNKFRDLSEAEERKWNENFEKLEKKILDLEVADIELQLLSDMQVCKILGVSERTMRTYRAKGYFHYMKLGGRIFYVEVIFRYDVMVHILCSGR